jgi:hypothetical protein
VIKKTNLLYFTDISVGKKCKNCLQCIIFHLGSGSKIFVVNKITLPPIRCRESVPLRLPEARVSGSHSRLKNCSILQRNVKSCLETAKRNGNPMDRIRYNDPEHEIPRAPTLRDFGDHLLEMATSLQDYSLELNTLSNILIQDRNMAPGSEQRENAKRRIQHCMDTARYMAPHLQNLTNFVIPLNAPAPRPLLTAEDSSRSNPSSHS